MKMRKDCLMMVTDRSTLYIFSFPDLVVASSPEGNVLTPSATLDVSFIGPFNEIAHTNAIDFDEECIFQCTTQGFRILARGTGKELYVIQNAGWQKVSQGKWAKCFTSNAFALEPETGTAVAAAPIREHLEKRIEIIQVRKGTSPNRKAKDWKWDILNIAAEGGMVLMSFGGGWLAGIPDYRALIEGNRTMDNGSWVLDLGPSCQDMVFDGRRVVCLQVRLVRHRRYPRL